MGLSAKLFIAGAFAQTDGESYTWASLNPALILSTERDHEREAIQ